MQRYGIFIRTFLIQNSEKGLFTDLACFVILKTEGFGIQLVKPSISWIAEQNLRILSPSKDRFRPV